MDPEVACRCQLLHRQVMHWSDPCEALMHNIGTAIRGGKAAASEGVPPPHPVASGKPEICTDPENGRS